MAHWRARSPKLGLGGLSKPERTWNTSFTHVLGQPYLSIPFPLPHYTTMPPLMKPLGMKLLYSEHGVLKRNNSFINHTKQSRNISGGSAAIFLLIYAVWAQISSGTVLIHLPKLKENRVYPPSLETLSPTTSGILRPLTFPTTNVVQQNYLLRAH